MSTFREVDLAHTAILYQETYHMKWAPPFLSNCLQAAGYVRYYLVNLLVSWRITLFVAFYVLSHVWNCFVRKILWLLTGFVVRFKPMDTQASVALQKLINALAGLEVRS